MISLTELMTRMDRADYCNYIYLHGFASSPHSVKAEYLRDRFSGAGINLQIPDLNQSDFSHLTLTRQIQQVEAAFPPVDSPHLHLNQGESEGVTLIGSSFGGLTAARLAQQHLQVQRLILLAPAFQFLSHWLPKLGEQELAKWQSEGCFSVYHYGEKQYLPLNYQFILDMAKYQDEDLQRPVPTLIFHGREDEVIPIQSSRDFAAARSWVQLVELDSDHALGNVLCEIWDEIQNFCQLKVKI